MLTVTVWGEEPKARRGNILGKGEGALILEIQWESFSSLLILESKVSTRG